MRARNKNYLVRQLLSIVLSVIVVGVGFYLVSNAFNGPSGSGGTGSGAIAVDTSNNLAVGTSTTSNTTKLFIVASSTNSTEYALRAIQPAGGALFTVRNDGNVGVATGTPSAATLTVQGTVYSSGGYTGNLSASNVTANVFASGNFAFPGSLGVNTSTQVSLPSVLSVYGTSTLLGTVGVNTSTPSYTLDVNGAMRLYPGSAPTGAKGVIYYDSAADKFKCYEGAAFTNCVGSGTGSVGGSGTSTYLAYWSTSSTLSSDSSLFWATSTNDLGIGTSSPAYNLDVAGTGRFTGDVILGNNAGTDLTVGGGSGKIAAGTLDPVYIINGTHYATYGADMTGVKGETTGVARLSKNGSAYSYTINFAGQPVGSDLWLFGKTTDIKHHFADMSVILSPSFDGSVWYEKDAAAGTLTLYGRPGNGGSGDLEVSYRLTAPRFDAASWGNLSSDPEVSGFILNDQ